MQQQQQQYGPPPPPDIPPFASSSGAPAPHMLHPPEAASPINSRPPPPSRLDDIVLPDDHAIGDEAERGGVPGNRWPRQETLALLKIRSDMDAAFRDATLKGPLWEDVSRKLAELGYRRSSKKCKEKFENVHKYYKRTKEGRAGRQDGKSYRFFTQLEALHTAGAPTPATTGAPFPISMSTPARIPISPAPAFTPPPPPPAPAAAPPDMTPATAPTPTPISLAAAGISFSSDTFSTSSYDSDDETEEGEGRKRKREGGQGGSRKMMAFFEGLMKQVMERQETMQQRFLETIEKREQDRMIREEAWKRQEIARLNREHELLAQERAMAASRDAAVMSFLQKISGGQPMSPALFVPVAPPPQPMPVPTPVVHPQHPPPPPPPPPAVSIMTPPPPQRQPEPPIRLPLPAPAAPSTSVLVPESHDHIVCTIEGGSVSSSRWPKSEVHALIKLRSGLESKYQEAGPKGPLWEEISAGMQQLGYSRSSKRCKEKWENINKYFKKVKESNKKRPEDAKTCPYFHQLEALYLKKAATGGGGGGRRPIEIELSPNPIPPIPPAPQPSPHPQGADSNSNGNGSKPRGSEVSGGVPVPTGNGGLPPSLLEQGTSGRAAMKKPEDIMNKLMDHQKEAGMDDYGKMEEHDSDNLDDDDDDDDDEEDRKMQYKIQFQPQNVNAGGGGGNGGSGGSSSAAAAAKATGSFLAMVQ